VSIGEICSVTSKSIKFSRGSCFIIFHFPARSQLISDGIRKIDGKAISPSSGIMPSKDPHGISGIYENFYHAAH
jgi:hypothetical protein